MRVFVRSAFGGSVCINGEMIGKRKQMFDVESRIRTIICIFVDVDGSMGFVIRKEILEVGMMMDSFF